MKYPNILSVSDVKSSRDLHEINGEWVPARPVGYPSFASRIIAAWLVFIGKADALKWPGNQ